MTPMPTSALPMGIALQAAPAAGPHVPWWVLYAVVLAVVWGTWRITRARRLAGCGVAVAGFLVVLVTAVMALPVEHVGLIFLLAIVPAATFAMAALSRMRATGPALAGVDDSIALPTTGARLTPELMQGQPDPRQVLRSKMMAERHAAGMPQEIRFIARMTYVSGLVGEPEPRPVDVFAGGAKLWIAPLKSGSELHRIDLDDVLRVDVWPEIDAPPTLRVSWSPPAGEATRELVLGAVRDVPPPLVARQLTAIAGAITDLVSADARTRLSGEPPKS